MTAVSSEEYEAFRVAVRRVQDALASLPADAQLIVMATAVMEFCDELAIPDSKLADVVAELRRLRAEGPRPPEGPQN
jgi:hypothetical protein